MTVATTTSRVSYPGAGSVGPFSIPYRVSAAADLLVTKRDTDDVETTLAENTDFTVTGEGSATGTLTLLVALAVGETLVIRRAPALTQTTSLRNQGAYAASSHEDALDRIVMELQSVDDVVRRSFRLTESYDPDDHTMELPPGASGQVVGWQGGSLANLDLVSGLILNAVYNSADYLVGNGVTNDAAALSTLANTTIPAGGGTILFAPGSYKIGTNITIPANVTLWFLHGASLKVAAGVTVTVNGDIKADFAMAFDLTLGGALDIPSAEVRPEWFSHSTDPDDSLGIQRALQAARHLRFAFKTYTVQTPGAGAYVMRITRATTIVSDGATLSHATHDGITISVADLVDDWSILGRLTILGNGNADFTHKGLQIEGSRRYMIENIVFKDIAGIGLFVPGGTFTTPGGQGQIAQMLCWNCWIGFQCDETTSAEFIQINSFNALSCTEAARIKAGNTQILGGNVTHNQAGVRWYGGGNSAHGQIVGVKFAHNIDYNVKFTDITLGQSLIGCHIYGDSTTTGWIWIENSQGIDIVGGIIDAPIKNITPVGFSKIQAAFVDGARTVLTDASKKTLFLECFRSADAFADGFAFAGPFTAPTFANAWVNYDAAVYHAAGYFKDPFGVVHLRGVLKTGTLGLKAFTLPAGFRPTLSSIFACASNDAYGTCYVNANGDVIPFNGSNVTFSLDGISFRTD